MIDDRVRVTDDRPQYAHVPFPLIKSMRDGFVSYSAVALYASLDAYRDRQTQSCFPSYRTLARDLGLGIATVHRLIRELVLAGFVRIDRPDNPSRPVVFVLLFSPPPRGRSVPKSERAFRSRSASLPVRGPDTPRGEGSRSTPITTPIHSSDIHSNHAPTREQEGSGEDPNQMTFGEDRFRRLLAQRARARGGT